MTEIVAQPTETVHRRDEVVSWALSLLVMGNIILVFGFGLAFSLLTTRILGLYDNDVWADLGGG